ncbi:DnaJ domain-containing protein [uncultured Legionella sp.]|uniref:DnaJ domain-containing protein n=1 Tax=uncultured Legionella sp. TaxID=210934 RepID=UPI002603260C|nr:DnaJ domain-containing protein [uncultured Legionella sp.]
MYKQINKDNAVKWLNGAVISKNIDTLNVLLKFEPIIAEATNQSILKSAFSTSNKAIINRLLSVPEVLQYIKGNYRQYQAEYYRYVEPFLASNNSGNFNTQNNFESFADTPFERFMGTEPTLNPSSFWNTLSRPETTTQRNFNQLETLIACCKAGVVKDLKQCLAREVHKKDNKGTALYWALCYGHEDCVRELIAVDVPIQPKHYYAAALIPENKNEKTNAVDLYKLIRKSSGARKTDYPLMILEGNLDELQHALPDLDQEKASAYLYKLLSLGHINCVRSILEQSNVSLEPRHYFAAAQGKDHISAKKTYDCLAFYQIKPANLHAILAADILGVHANAPDWVIKKTYKALLLEFHPDKNPNDTKRAEEAPKKINTAKESLLAHKGRESVREDFFTTNFPQSASTAFNI